MLSKIVLKSRIVSEGFDMKKKLLVILLFILYAIPYVFLGMYCQWIDYGLFMTSLTFLTFIPPFVYAYICAKKGLKSLLIYGNILTFITSLITTLILNAIGLTDELGGSWYGTFKPFSSTQMVVMCSIISAIIQSIIYLKSKIRKD